MFLKDVAVNIYYCAVIRSDEGTSKFKFIIAKCSQEELPYQFRERKGVFNPYTQYTAIKLKQFSLVGGVAPEALNCATLRVLSRIGVLGGRRSAHRAPNNYTQAHMTQGGSKM